MRKLYRSRQDKKISGLCGGLSDLLNVDATLIRILLIVITVFSSGMVIFVYLIAAMVVPKEPSHHQQFDPYAGASRSTGGFKKDFSNDFNFSSKQWGQTSHREDPATSSQFDSMMDDLERKTLRREIDELKTKLAKYEKGEL